MNESGPQVTVFPSAALFRDWLEKHHATERELWVGYHKKSSGKVSISYSEAVDEALCFGWIDGKARSVDESTYANRYTPRRPRSTWSNTMVRRVEQLLAEGRMHPAGIAAFQAREPGRTGVYSFEQPPVRLDPAYEARFRAHAAAWSFFKAQAGTYCQAALHWVMSAKKEETRSRRLERLIDDSNGGRRMTQFSRPGR